MSTIRTNYKDDILAAAMDGKRQYQMINNPNGTISFNDVTEYTQNGDVFSAGDINSTNAKINENTALGNTDITNDLSRLLPAIAEQNLEKYGYTIGDYFYGLEHTTSPGSRLVRNMYWLADMNTFYTTRQSLYACVTTPHIAIIVDTMSYGTWSYIDYQIDGRMRYDNTTLYTNLRSVYLDQVKTDIESLFGGSWEDHLLSRTILASRPGRTGTYAGEWYSYVALQNEYITALTESQVFGAPILSRSNREQGEGFKKLKIFDKYAPSFIISFAPSATDYLWLRSCGKYQELGTDPETSMPVWIEHDQFCSCIINGYPYIPQRSSTSILRGEYVGLILLH